MIMIVIIIVSLARSLTHSLTHLLSHSLTHSLTRSLVPCHPQVAVAARLIDSLESLSPVPSGYMYSEQFRTWAISLN